MTGLRSNPRVLAVDDDPSVLRWLAAILSSADLAVDHCGSAAEAQSLLGERSYSLVITDLQMPGASGHSIGNANLVKARALFEFLRRDVLPPLVPPLIATPH